MLGVKEDGLLNCHTQCNQHIHTRTLTHTHARALTHTHTHIALLFRLSGDTCEECLGGEISDQAPRMSCTRRPTHLGINLTWSPTGPTDELRREAHTLGNIPDMVCEAVAVCVCVCVCVCV